jgi:hypothetical protein
MKSGSLNLLEPNGPHRSYYGTALSFTTILLLFLYHCQNCTWFLIVLRGCLQQALRLTDSTFAFIFKFTYKFANVSYLHNILKFKVFLFGYILIHIYGIFSIFSLLNILIRQFWLPPTQTQAARSSLHSSPKLLASKFFQPYYSLFLIYCTDNSEILVKALEFPVVKIKKRIFRRVRKIAKSDY